MRRYESMPRARLTEILEGMRAVRVGVLGDICLDVYWLADMRRSALSRETPHFPLPVVEERMSPGAGGNVAANARALRPRGVSVISAVGEDWRGRELTRLLEKLDIDTKGIVRSRELGTNAYIKPLRRGISDIVYEDPRLDFAPLQPPSAALETRLLEALDACAGEVDVLCVADQLTNGVVTKAVRESACARSRSGCIVVADSRENIARYRDIYLKPNEYEAHRAVWGEEAGEASEATAKRLARGTNGRVFLTLGGQGALYTEGEDVWHIPARQVRGEIDFCGAGDTALAGFALSLAAGATHAEAAYVAGLCSEVTIQQIGVTGVATPEQVLRWHEENTE